MNAHDVQAALVNLKTAGNDRQPAFTKLAPFNGGGIFVGRFSGKTPWERHPSGDELLHILDGQVEVTIDTGKNPIQVTLQTGSVLVVPRGRWHCQNAPTTVTLLSATPAPTLVSVKPPSGSEATRRTGRRRAASHGR